MQLPPAQVDLDSTQKPIHFRPFALRRYQNRTELPVTLKIDSGRRLAILWPGVLLLLASGVALWSRAVPVYVSAHVVRTDALDSHRRNADQSSAVVSAGPTDSRQLILLLFVKDDKLRYFSPGNTIVLTAPRQRVNATVVAVEPSTALSEKFELPPEASAPTTGPSAIVVIQPEADAGALDRREIQVEIGERRLVGMLPLVRSIF